MRRVDINFSFDLSLKMQQDETVHAASRTGLCIQGDVPIIALASLGDNCAPAGGDVLQPTTSEASLSTAER